MALLPQRRSPLWLLVFVVTAVAWTGAVLLAGWLNRGEPPTWVTVASAGKVLAAITGALAVLGALGARATFIGAHLGLLVGYAMMVNTFTTTNEGMADLAAVATFLMLGSIGLAVGVIVDIVLVIRSRRRGGP